MGGWGAQISFDFYAHLLRIVFCPLLPPALPLGALTPLPCGSWERFGDGQGPGPKRQALSRSKPSAPELFSISHHRSGEGLVGLERGGGKAAGGTVKLAGREAKKEGAEYQSRR